MRRKIGIRPSCFLYALPKAAHCGFNTTRHRLAYIPDGMQMIGHETIMENLNLWIEGGISNLIIQDSPS
jgi:hypothetical protein